MKIILYGAQGSGKGTVGKILSEKLNIPLISTGDLLRAMKPQDPHYDAIQKMMLEGGFENQDIIADILKTRISNSDCANGFILDGWGRKLVDIELYNPQVDIAINLVISRDLSVKRIIGRRLCPKDNFMCNVFFRQPKVEGKCDICGGDLVKREDDTEDAVNARLNTFYSETMLVINRYKEEGKLIEVPAEGTAEETADAILALLARL
jgi:adenylate kinase